MLQRVAKAAYSPEAFRRFLSRSADRRAEGAPTGGMLVVCCHRPAYSSEVSDGRSALGESLAGLGFPLLSAAVAGCGCVCACLAICLVGCFARGDLVKMTHAPTARTLSKPSQHFVNYPKSCMRGLRPGPLLLTSGMVVTRYLSRYCAYVSCESQGPHVSGTYSLI